MQSGKGEQYIYYAQRLFIALETGNYDLLTGALNTLPASIPYDDFSKAAEQNVIVNSYKFPAQEWLYRFIILSFLRGCGVVVAAELHTHPGRPDLVISYMNLTWVIEIKVAYTGQSADRKALSNAICLGLGIDDAARQICAWRMDSL